MAIFNNLLTITASYGDDQDLPVFEYYDRLGEDLADQGKSVCIHALLHNHGEINSCSLSLCMQ